MSQDAAIRFLPVAMIFVEKTDKIHIQNSQAKSIETVIGF